MPSGDHYRQGTHSPVNIWLTREGEEDRQVAMATTPYKASELVRLANLGLEVEEKATAEGGGA